MAQLLEVTERTYEEMAFGWREIPETVMEKLANLPESPHRMTSRNTAIIEAVRKGENPSSVAKRYGITRQRVGDIIRQYSGAKSVDELRLSTAKRKT